MKVSGACKLQILIDADIKFTIDERGLEVFEVEAQADIKGGTIGLDPPIQMSDADVNKLRLTLADCAVANVAHQSREALKNLGGAPIVEIHNQNLKPQGPLH